MPLRRTDIRPQIIGGREIYPLHATAYFPQACLLSS